VVDAGVVPNADVVGGAGLVNALVVFAAPKAPNPVAGLRTDPPKPEGACAVGVVDEALPKEPNMLLDALGSVGCAPPRDNPPNPPEKAGVESDMDASRVMSVEDSAWLPDAGGVAVLPKLGCPNTLPVLWLPNAPEPKAPPLPKALVPPEPNAAKPKAGCALPNDEVVAG
jgi:hypothetical protein